MQLPPDTQDVQYQAITRALDAILSTDKFLAAPQMSAFLRYVVEQAAKGQQSRIKAYTVAVDALGKPDTFDPQNDPVVRVLAGRLRTSLDAYHDANPDVDIIIQMKRGSYVPSFIHRESAQKDVSSDERRDGQYEKSTESEHDVDASTGTPAPSTSSTAEPSNTPLTQSAVTPAGIPASTSRAANHQWTARLDDVPDPQVDARPMAAITTLQQEQAVNTSQQPFRDASAGTDPAQISSDVRRSSDGWGGSRSIPLGALAVCAALAGVGFYAAQQPAKEPDLLAGTAANNLYGANGESGALANGPAVFISAMDNTESMESQLNTMISGVFSESPDIQVYRITPSTQDQQYSPEDYILSLDVVPLSDETRVSVQIMEAQTGRVSHSDTLLLSGDAKDQLSQAELTAIFDFARQLVDENGPLMSAYRKQSSL